MHSFLFEAHGTTSPLVLNELKFYFEKKITAEILNESYILVTHEDFTLFSLLSTIYLRTPKRIYLHLKSEIIDTQEELYTFASDIPWPDIFSHELSFAVRANHKKFDKITIGKIVGQAIVDSFLEKTKKRPKVNLKNPDIEILVVTINDKTHLLIALTPDNFNTPINAATSCLVSWFISENLENHKELCGLSKEDCNFVSKFLVKEPLLDRITTLPLLNINLLDQERTIKLVSQIQTTRRNIKLPSCNTYLHHSSSNCHVLFANLFYMNINKKDQLELFSKLLREKEAFTHIAAVFREDILQELQNKYNFKLQKLAKLNIKGIDSIIAIISN